MKLLKSEFFQCVGGLNITLTYGTKNSGWALNFGLCSIRTRYVSFPKGRLVSFFLSGKKGCLFLSKIRPPRGSRHPPLA